jgi:hypothetical protein
VHSLFEQGNVGIDQSFKVRLGIGRSQKHLNDLVLEGEFGLVCFVDVDDSELFRAEEFVFASYLDELFAIGQ